MAISGYYRHPTIHGDTVVFVSEDDLWAVPTEGGVARRLTANLGAISSPYFSPDGKLIAYTGRDEGHSEVYCMDAEGGPATRLTYLGVSTNVIGWTPDGASILFSSDHEQPVDRIDIAFSIPVDGSLPVQLPIGPALSISVKSGNRTVIGRNNNDPARWKRYKGGTAGDIWVDADGSGEFRRLVQLNGNVGRPMWIGDRVYFLSDHAGIANIFSTTAQGEDLTQHTHQKAFYVRFPSTDGEQIVYHAGADLYVYDTRSGREHQIDVKYHSPCVYRQRKFTDAAKYLQSYALSPHGDSLAITSRGKSFTFGNWEGAVKELVADSSAPVRIRLTQWLNDGERMVTVTDRGGEEAIEIHDAALSSEPIRLSALDIGKPTDMQISPAANRAAISNHRNELVVVDLDAATLTLIDKSIFGGIAGFDWSPDGRWIAYAFSGTQYTSEIKLWDGTTSETHTVTRPMLRDTAPAFDPEGKYLYFIGQRELNPVYDMLTFDLGFPRGERPYLITLQAGLTSPFQPTPHPLTESGKAKEKQGDAAADEDKDKDKDGEKSAEAGDDVTKKPVVIDLEGIADRVVAFPVPEGVYHRIAGIRSKALFTSYPVMGALRQGNNGDDSAPRGVLESFDFKEQKHEALIHRVSDFEVGSDYKTMVYRSDKKLRVVTAGAKPDDKAGQEPGRRSGWVDLGRVKVSVDPQIEWQQMAREAWRLQRDHFWTENMSSINWTAVWHRYSPLIARVGTRGEFSDLMWEMQGELGTSHAYEMGGDYRPEPTYPQGFLGANIGYDAANACYRIDHIVKGDAGNARSSSPLCAPGVNVKEGDSIVAINGKKLTLGYSPYQALTHQAGAEVTLTVQSPDTPPRDVTVVALRSETAARYREWVEANRRHVHEATDGKVGYVHIPDMGPHGYAEFHRLYLSEVDRDAMIVDVRFNRGGHVSQLLIEKLNRKRVGYDISRWGQPEPYPSASVAGPIVAITNQFAGSDGDIFSHVFKLMKIGTLIGKRTWGGVIGISPRHALADGSLTTQPEFSFWFKDVGWRVENYGTDPDIDIDVAPQDYARGYDPQMAKAIEVILDQLDKQPVVKPGFDARPSLPLPWEERTG